ncbi:Uncharacterised protein [uncultured archaeon]|nr:Uncharacterised protein [uncultured archaeon]
MEKRVLRGGDFRELEEVHLPAGVEVCSQTFFGRHFWVMDWLRRNPLGLAGDVNVADLGGGCSPAAGLAHSNARGRRFSWEPLEIFDALSKAGVRANVDVYDIRSVVAEVVNGQGAVFVSRLDNPSRDAFPPGYADEFLLGCKSHTHSQAFLDGDLVKGLTVSHARTIEIPPEIRERINGFAADYTREDFFRPDGRENHYDLIVRLGPGLRKEVGEEVMNQPNVNAVFRALKPGGRYLVRSDFDAGGLPWVRPDVAAPAGYVILQKP